MLPLVRVGDEEGLGGGVLLVAEVQLLHLLVLGPDTNKGTKLGSCKV